MLGQFHKSFSQDLDYEFTLQWCHYVHGGISNHQPHHCLLNHLFRHRSKKTSKLDVTRLCIGNSPVTCEFPTQMANNAENVSIWWRHHDILFVKWARGQTLVMYLLWWFQTGKPPILINPCHAEFMSGNMKYIFAFFITSQHWNGTGIWNASWWKTRTYSSCTFNTMLANDLPVWGARASPTIVWILGNPGIFCLQHQKN